MSKQTNKSRDPNKQIGLQLRMKEGLRAEIEAGAKQSARSMNAEIVSRLEASFAEQSHFGSPSLQQAFKLIALEANRLSSRTKTEWDQSRASCLALSKVAQSVVDYSVPKENLDEMLAVLDEATEAREALQRKLHFLLEAGAITKIEKGQGYPTNALMPKAIVAENYLPALPPEKYALVLGFVLQEGFRFVIDLNEPPRNWKVERDGTPLEEAELNGIASVIDSMRGFVEEFAKCMDRIKTLEEPEEKAKAEAEMLIEKLGY